MAENEHNFRRGKWSDPEVPHKGWTCVWVDDLGEPSELCQMCESKEIRYVHYMTHPDYPEELPVGCVCAENMEQDYVNPRQREKKLKNLARRRKSWAKRQWRESARGNYYLNVEGYNIALFQKTDRRGTYWSLVIKNRLDENAQFSNRRYETLERVKQAALTALVWAKNNGL